MDDKLKNSFVTRVISGAIFAIIVVGSLLLSKYTFAILLSVICIGGMREFYKLAKAANTSPMVGAGVTLGVIVILLTFLACYAPQQMFSVVDFGTLLRILICFPIAAFFVIFIRELYRKKENPLTNIATTLMGVFYVAFPLAMLIIISYLGGPLGNSMNNFIPKYYPWTIICYLAIVWGNDVGAYLFGVAFGKHRLFERISPKKSWEGFFGGLIVAIGCGILAGLLLDQSILFWSGLASLVVATGVWGDLVESMFKRAAGVKDSGAIMPGHGGFLDRFDALLMSAPFVMVYFIIFA